MDTVCALAEQLYDSTGLHIVEGLQTIVSLVIIILCMYTALKYVQKSIFEASTKELIVTLFVICIIHAVPIGLIQIIHLISYYSALSPCDAQIPNKLCVSMDWFINSYRIWGSPCWNQNSTVSIDF
ncbi:hypothetical protein PMAYCL1PPCAC_16512 [Pristionchus mayeri]|uniref:G protein-coupled receptor n=1 Tax=Pristionchus mayeri TaxID=1317129 RepID=A0AAN5HZB5_9BILA|nr:hypothetical protein PMAYCL1PPCAC_16512 [Pristionchus mayeri]